MPSPRYERLASEPEQISPKDCRFDLAEEEANIGRRSPNPRHVAFARDPRFELPTPPAWQRVALVLFLVFLFWLVFKLRVDAAEAEFPNFVD
jgi:hypothetical protein